MSADANLDDGSLGTSEAYAAIEAYARECGRVPLLLLLHSAVPQSFRPDLLNLIKANFVPEAEADLSVDADVLFSPLVKPLGGGFHRLDAEVRRQCLLLLDAMHKDGPERRSVSVARFLLTYADDREGRPGVAEDWLLLEHLAVQRWVARAFLDPAETAELFAAALAEAPTEGKAAARLRLGSVASALSVPLVGHPELIAYARGLEALKTGDANEARRQLDLLGGDQITIGGVVLRPAAEVLRGNGAMQQRDGQVSFVGESFQYDVFISYAQGGFDQSDRSPLRTWSQVFATKFVEELRLSLAGGQVVAFLDENGQPGFGIDPTRPLTAQLQQAIHGSALLVVLMSPFFLKSEWCMREINWFVAEAKRRQRGDGLLFIVHIWPTQDGDWPPEFKGKDVEMLPGYWFYDRELAAEEPARVRPFGWIDPGQHHSHAFYSTLADVAAAAAIRLERLRQQCEVRRHEKAEYGAESSGQVVYLYARDTHRHLWERAYDSLEQAGFLVLPSEPDPDPTVVGPERASRAAAERVALLKASDALVLLLPISGRNFDIEFLTVAVQDRRRAQEGGGKLLPCVVVNLAGVDHPNDRLRRFARRGSRIGWIDGGPDWPTKVRQYLMTEVPEG